MVNAEYFSFVAVILQITVTLRLYYSSGAAAEHPDE